MPECVDLTLDSDDEANVASRAKKRPRPPSPDSDCVLIDEDDQQQKRHRSSEQQAQQQQDDDVVVASATGMVALRDMAHTRPQCGNHAFRQTTNSENSKRCGQCFCFVCDVKAEQCQYWGTGTRVRDHCNAHSSHYWNSLRRVARKGSSSAALLQQEFTNNSLMLSTNWTLPVNNSTHDSSTAAARRSLPSGARGMVSPLTAMWARKAAETAAHTPAAAAAGGSSGGGAAPSTAPGHLGVPGTAVKTEGSKQQQKQPGSTPKRPAPPPASSWLKRMPHPSQAKSPMQLLASLELPFKTVKGVRVDDVVRRLVPCGFYKESGAKAVVQYGEHLLLDNINNAAYNHEKRREVSNVLRLLPLLPADGLPAEPDKLRPFSFTVISTTPGVKPLAVGVTVPAGSKVSSLMSAVEEGLKDSGYSSTEEGLLLALQEKRQSDVDDDEDDGVFLWFKDPEFKLTDHSRYFSTRNRWLAVRVPAAVAQDWNKPDAPNSWRHTPAKILLLHHEKFEPRPAEELNNADDDCDSQPHLDYLLGDGEVDRALEELGIDPQQRERENSLLRRRRLKVVPIWPPTAILVEDEGHLRGSTAADKAVQEALIRQLVHYRSEGQLGPSSQPSQWGLTLYPLSGSARQRSFNRSYSAVSATRTFSMMTEALPVAHQSAAARLWVHWGTEPLQPPAGFNMEAFATPPELNDPAFEERLKGLPDLLKATECFTSSMNLVKNMPSEIMRELQSACACSPPIINETPQARLAFTHKPSAAAVLSVIKAPGSSSKPSKASSSKAGSSKGSSSKAAAAAEVAAEGSSAAAAIAAIVAQGAAQGKSISLERIGVLKVDVYVWTTPGRYHDRLFDDYDEWSSSYTGRPGRFRSTVCRLAAVLNARLLQEAGGYRVLQELQDLNGTRKPPAGIAKLMQWVAAGERSPAVQPPGLTVQLHPYQLQSLAFMQEAEQWEGGWRHLLWHRLTPKPTQQQQQQNGQQQQQQQQLALAGPSSSSALAAAAAAGGASGGGGVWWSPVLGRVSAQVPPAPWGGFLAEEMGLGKTVEVLALILSNPAPPSVIAGSIDPESGKVVSRGTLVVCAVSLVGQWCVEANKKLNGSLKMYPYHGSNRIRDRKRLATEFDIVVTTYATLGSDFGGKRNQHRADNPLGDIKWHRIVFDEGHTVKNMSAAHSKACTALFSDRRWICTGTPINNDISDLLGQFAVLHMQPFATKSYFDAYVKHAFTSYGYGVTAVPLLHTLRHTMIRHTKAQTIDGQSVLALPDKTEEMVPVVLTPPEREAYLRVHGEAAAVWAAVRSRSFAAINQKLLQIMSLLQPLRRICSGGRLTPQDLRVPNDLALETQHVHHNITPAAAAAKGAAAAAAAGSSMQVQEDCNITVPDLECPICLDAFDSPVMTSCSHWYCKECILGVLSSSTHCPLCRGPVVAADLRAPGKKPEPAPKKRRRVKDSSGSGDDSSSDGDYEEEEDAAAGGNDASTGFSTRRGTRFGHGAQDAEVVVCESKLHALLAELSAMRAADPSSKALVFSQYTSTLEWLKQRLPEEGFGYRTITGSMPLKQRAKAIEAFQGDPPTTVFLLSIRSGAVGINLTAANHVFLLEPCINPALEEQAIGRAWRMGQQRKVVVKRFYVKGSIEERIMDVRNIRQGHTAGSSGSSGAAAAAAAASAEDAPPARMGKKKIAAAELAGNLQADRQVLKIAELDLLFRTPELETDSSTQGGAAAAAAGDGAGSSRQAEAAAAAAAAAGDGAGSSRQAEEAAAAAAGGASSRGSAGATPSPPAAAAGDAAGVTGPFQAAAAAAAAGGGSSIEAARQLMPSVSPPPTDLLAMHTTAQQASAAASAALAAATSSMAALVNPPAGLSVWGATGGSSSAAAAAAAGGTGLLEVYQDAQQLAAAAEAGLQSSQQQLTPYLYSQVLQQQWQLQMFEQMQQQQQQQGQGQDGQQQQ